LDRSCGKWNVTRSQGGERSILQTIRRRQGNWLGHILRRNCLLKQVIEGKIGARTSNGKTRKKT